MFVFELCPMGKENTNGQLESISKTKTLDTNDKTDIKLWISNIRVSTTICFVS